MLAVMQLTILLTAFLVSQQSETVTCAFWRMFFHELRTCRQSCTTTSTTNATAVRSPQPPTCYAHEFLAELNSPDAAVIFSLKHTAICSITCCKVGADYMLQLVLSTPAGQSTRHICLHTRLRTDLCRTPKPSLDQTSRPILCLSSQRDRTNKGTGAVYAMTDCWHAYQVSLRLLLSRIAAPPTLNRVFVISMPLFVPGYQLYVKFSVLTTKA